MAGQREVLRNRGLVGFCWAAAAFFLVTIPVNIATTTHRTIADYAGLTTLGLVAAALFYRGTRTRIEMSDSGLDVFKLGPTVHVAWADVADVAVDYYGLHIVLTDERVVTVAGMGKPNWATWLKKEAAADRWARRITARAEEQRQEEAER